MQGGFSSDNGRQRILTAVALPGKETRPMDVQTSWQAFACTGNILRYLEYKQTQMPDEHPAGDTDHGDLCNTGSGVERDPL